MHEQNNARREVQFDHVHKVEVNDIKHFDRLLLCTACSVPFFVMCDSHAGDCLQVCAVRFDELDGLHCFTPKFDVAIN